MDRVGELAAAVGPEQVAGVQRVESLDAMPLLWAIDDALLALDRLPELRPQSRHERGQAHGQERRPEDERDDGRRGGPRRRERPRQLAALKDRLRGIRCSWAR